MNAESASSSTIPNPALISERAYEKRSRSHRFAGLALFHAGSRGFLRRPGHPRTRDIHEFLAWLAVIEPGMIGSGNDCFVHPPPVWKQTGQGTVRPSAILCATWQPGANTDDYNIVITARPQRKPAGRVIKTLLFRARGRKSPYRRNDLIVDVEVACGRKRVGGNLPRLSPRVTAALSEATSRCPC